VDPDVERLTSWLEVSAVILFALSVAIGGWAYFGGGRGISIGLTGAALVLVGASAVIRLLNRTGGHR
jgi:TRAP-type C4-dicarboxylate transport system permease small subunit